VITKTIIKILPPILRKKVENNQELRQIMGNINWLTFENILRNLIGVFVFAWVARYLGPEQFGLMNYAVAFVTLFSVFSTLGLDDILVREIVSSPEKRKEYLGSALFLKFVGALVLVITATLTSHFINSEDAVITFFVFIVSLGYIFKSFDVIDLWFKSQVKSKYSVYSRATSFFVVSVIKIILILTQAPLVAFVWMFTLDFFIAALLLIYFYSQKVPDSMLDWKVRIKTAKNLLKDSWPLMLSGVAVVIYMKIDQVMIGNMLGEKELGIYSSAVKLSEAWYFVPMIISSSVFPSILRVRKKSKELYLRRIQMLYDFFTWFTIGVALIVTFLSPFIINILYGSEYAMASTVLSIHIWAGVFVFLGVASSNYLIAENLTKITFYRTLAGVTVNIFLNLILVPFYGIMGAAFATLVSQFVSAFFSNLFFKKSRIIFIMFLKSLNLFILFKKIK
jgi:O-antigen/teichoic acid export membrane protein